MNNTIGIKSNFPEIAKKHKTVSKDIGRTATARALNKTVTQGRTEMARAISREFRVSATTARERLRVSRASITRGNLRLEATLLATSRAKGRSMNLIAFVAAGAKMTRKGRSRIKFRIKR
ncbi:MAG: hypothetical protein LBI87_08990, partial [Candidatus Accumulibacter sp.]|nr:hypothetical protein [Accumulibacter sp.]